jgi:uncharacterized protein (DUF58 family)
VPKPLPRLPSDFKLSQPSTWMRTATPVDKATTLSRNHLYILPTRFGWLFSVMLITLLIGSINYSISLGFAFTFLLAGFGAISMLYTWRNLANLHIQLFEAPAVFATEFCVFECIITERNHRARFAIHVQFSEKNSFSRKVSNQVSTLIDIESDAQTRFRLSYLTQQRGWLKMPRIKLSTEFPVSFFNVWAYAALDAECLVYPKPVDKSTISPSLDATGNTGNQHTPVGDDDFAGHRNYQFGDSPKRVDWKASSREQGMFTKQFQGEVVSTLWLDWDAATGDTIETRISQLTRWVINAEKSKANYGLRLPHLCLQPNHGQAHYHACLTALALM